jgi:hypothetical protein
MRSLSLISIVGLRQSAVGSRQQTALYAACYTRNGNCAACCIPRDIERMLTVVEMSLVTETADVPPKPQMQRTV